MMASSKFEQLWILMSQNHFEVYGKVNDSIICAICEKLLIEPYTSVCGCHFCGSCIRNFLGNSKRECPGKKADCKKTFLEIEKNVLTDFTTQFKVAKVIVKCPYPQCTMSTELEKMAEHIRCCTMKPTNCPYHSIGCVDGGTLSCSVIDHLHSETLSHSQLLIEAFNNLRNDFNSATVLNRKEINEPDQEFEQLKISEQKNRKELLELRQKVESKDGELNHLKKEIESLKKFEKIPKNDFDKFRRVSEKNGSEMDQLKKDLVALKSVVDAMQQKNPKAESNQGNWDETKLNQIKSDLEVLKDEIGNVKRTIEKVPKDEQWNKEIRKGDNEINNSKTESKKYTEDMAKINVRFKELVLRLTRDFVWTLSSFTNKKNMFHSHEFTKFYYKFHLTLEVNGESLKLSLRIMRGEFDEMLEWPMKHMFKLDLINQETMNVHKSNKYSFSTFVGDKLAFNRPTTDANGPITCFSFTLKELKTTPGLLLKDTSMFCCLIDK